MGAFVRLLDDRPVKGRMRKRKARPTRDDHSNFGSAFGCAARDPDRAVEFIVSAAAKKLDRFAF